ncbi:undecaprenyldiphospho-muramoylpentapeptide beta-N-acetylglucosaminyltransferase [Vagococcus martis]|uniref:UDP-N-acetylglucosamine--N-acetylmuramyl-(pentapeptide) pyrophosphoryl-undecaprenol N-acetylglucosamine transferase n=1 Tax=Vagococcus martis TaxID=1768210 RepID=A0A1V4DIA8_9ENTE|nr:undecaprenyldiphospho-muramoylpentapeptide beta-N-acetylglucosaminyltransferase [Vagococcus martis]OPF88265.1 undecaprenyldiphospho-muramoylpentapeptide beta-N-acetylglucosaminyltransferase [Vagococcus martis]
MKVLVSGGGTGGHIYPAISIVHYIREKYPESEFLYIGTEKGLESKLVPSQSIPFKTIEIQGFYRSLTLKNLKTMYLFLTSIKQAKRYIKEFQPDIVIGTGGYVCGSVVYAASKLNVPTIIHEQNSVAGMTNKFLSKYVDKVGICFSDAAEYFPTEKVELVGNPRAQEVTFIEKKPVLEEYGLSSSKPTIIIFGGSRGAQTINNAMKEALPLFEGKPYQVLYASGTIYFDEFNEYKDLIKRLDNVTIVPYIDNMVDVLVNVEALVGRAGATSMAEITALGLPSILVPSPNVTDDHQTKNAMSLVNKQAALMVKDNDLTGKVLVKNIDKLMLDDKFREDMAKASKKEGIPDAMDRLYGLIQELT